MGTPNTNYPASPQSFTKLSIIKLIIVIIIILILFIYSCLSRICAKCKGFSSHQNRVSENLCQIISSREIADTTTSMANCTNNLYTIVKQSVQICIFVQLSLYKKLDYNIVTYHLLRFIETLPWEPRLYGHWSKNVLLWIVKKNKCFLDIENTNFWQIDNKLNLISHYGYGYFEKKWRELITLYKNRCFKNNGNLCNEILQSITAETLIIQGAKDFSYQWEYWKLLKEQIPNSRFIFEIFLFSWVWNEFTESIYIFIQIYIRIIWLSLHIFLWHTQNMT